MRFAAFLNRFFRRPAVEGRDSALAYSDWEYRWGKDLIAEYMEPGRDFAGKTVLDIGCGLGGKTVAYGEAGTARIFGIDISPKHIAAADAYLRQHRRDFGWSLACADAARLPFADATFDTVMANDAMEHFAEPEAAMAEMARVLRPGGVIWVFFTPHFSPLGSHLYDYIYIPWCHLLFRRGQLESLVRHVLRERRPDAPDQVEKDVQRIMHSYDTDLNHMTIRRFFRIVRASGLDVAYLELKPAKFRALRLLTRVPGLRELFTGTVVCRLSRTG